MVWMFLGREPDKVYTLLHSEGIENIHLVCDNTINSYCHKLCKDTIFRLGSCCDSGPFGKGKERAEDQSISFD